MIEELAHLIKQDKESQNEFRKLVNEQKENTKLQENKMLKRARRVALTLGFAFVLVIISFTFVLITKIKSEENIQILDTQLNNARTELADCLKDANN